MNLISHRGNINGPNRNMENSPAQIGDILARGFDCEIDAWYIDGTFSLGHDEPIYAVPRKFLLKQGLWIHCKNLAALEMCPRGSNFFWHQNDDHSLTSYGFIWTFPEKPVGENSVIVDNSRGWRSKNYDCYGVCSDYIV